MRSPNMWKALYAWNKFPVGCYISAVAACTRQLLVSKLAHLAHNYAGFDLQEWNYPRQMAEPDACIAAALERLNAVETRPGYVWRLENGAVWLWNESAPTAATRIALVPVLRQ